MGVEPRFSSATVALLGQFSPEELTPQWFAERDLLSRRMTESAKVDTEDGKMRFVSDWLAFTAGPERISAETAQAPYVRVCDFVARTFHEHLCRSVLLEGFAIIRQSLYPLETEHAFDQITKAVVPFDEWTDEHTNERQAQVVIVQQQDDGVQVMLQLQGASSPPVIGITVAEGYHGYGKNGGADGNRDLIQVLGKRFDNTVRRADALIERVMSQNSLQRD